MTLGLIGLRGRVQRGVTEEEIAASLEEGREAGVIEEHEHQMVRNVFRLDERQIGSMMIPRGEIAWLDVADTPAQVLEMDSRMFQAVSEVLKDRAEGLKRARKSRRP